MANIACTEMYIKVNNKEEHNAVEQVLRDNFDLDHIYPDEELEEDEYPYVLEVSMNTNWSFPYWFFKTVFMEKFPHVIWNATSTESGNNHRCLASYRPDIENFLEPTEIEEIFSEF
jgi:hypothetical protein